MKKIKLKLSEFINPELLSVEAMKSLQGGGDACLIGEFCQVDGWIGQCQSVNGYCTCATPGGYGSTINCFE